MATLGFNDRDMSNKKVLSPDPKQQTFDMDIMKLLEEYLIDNPMTLTQLGKELRISYPTLLDFLKGKRKPNIKTKSSMMNFFKSKGKK
jgi:DNA-binding XRE family transcriptional regulator